MKRIIALLLTLALCLSLLPASVLAAESAQFVYSEEDIEELYYDFDYASALVEAQFCNDETIAYWKYANDMADKKVASWLIDKASTIIGEDVDEKYYAQLLTNMIALFEYDMAQQIESQSQFDKMKNVKEYGLDLIDIGASIIGLEGSIESIEKAIKAANDGIDLIMDTNNEIKYYELTIRNYANAENFLRAVNEYSDNKALSDAAYELRTANELLFKERITCIAGTAEETGVFLAKNYLSDFSFSLLRGIEEYKTDDIIKDYVDFGEQAYNALDKLVSTGEAVFKIVMLGGDLLFGTTNTFRRHNEMAAMADIAEALIAANNDIEVSLDTSAQTVYNNIRTKCEYYKMLLATHLRGEYLIYCLNYNDAGVLSQISKWADAYLRDEDETIKGWYEDQTDRIEEYYGIVEKVFDRLIREKFVVHNGFELHDGFIVEIEQLTEVPEGYIGVYTFADFKQIADSCPSDAFITSIYDEKTEFNTAKYILMNDIECPADYDPAGAFYGVLDGNGYSMKNLNKNLFVRLGNATVKNLGIEINYNEDLQDQECSFGAIARYVNGWNNENGVVIDNCFVKGSISISCRSGHFGGLIGNGEEAVITNCYNEADISIKTRQSGSIGGICGKSAPISNSFNNGDLSLYASCENTFNVESMDICGGGIQGYNYSDAISNCYNTGSVSITTALGCHVYTGGIVGYNYGSTFNCYITNCYNIGKVTNDWAAQYDPAEEYGGVFTPSYYSGGIVGFSGRNMYMSKCWNGGDISGEHFAGGLIGMLSADNSDSITDSYNVGTVTAVQYAGGILGKDGYSTTITRCYNAGMVSGALYCGAIAAEINEGEENLHACYYLDNGVPATCAGIGYSGVKLLSAEQMKDPNSFEGFDFLEVWKLREDDTVPLIKQ